MTNALSRFIHNRNISIETLHRAEILQIRGGRTFGLTYLRAIINNSNAGISSANIGRLDKAFKLTNEEKADLLSMVKKIRGGRGRTQGPIDTERNKRERQKSREVQNHYFTISECTTARESIVELRKKSIEFKLILCVNWEQHAKINQLSPQEVLSAFIEAHLKNRTEAAQAQLKLVKILSHFMHIVEDGLKNEIETFGKIPSVFPTLDVAGIKEHTENVLQHGEHKLFALMNGDTSSAQEHYMKWIHSEAQNNSGVVDITKYQPPKDILNVDAWLECLAFEDLAYNKTSMSFFGGGETAKETLEFYGVEEVITIVEQSAKRNIADLITPKEVLLE